ncbi:DUF2007 domain-containing protein [Hahella sp. CR1]|uniref:putative signal transducing protein n=1 Tax=unclassified Hahella TaxID=2624107 RepID=UPI001C1F0E1C|nr:DUF2007 domain-containing protein [Hahella sp. CR1]MBU6954121.1 DUF2007 domain-containing protein [Hahella sp. HN01]MDG9668792.1 DUF2007 domain-containing protein [Hahella sp. CR1]
MRQVYEAANVLEAHMIKGVLEQSGVTGFIDGEFLQGGMGELPAAGLVRISVNDVDYEQARSILRDWENSQVQDAHTPASQFTGWIGIFLFGFITGLVTAFWLM